MNDRDWTAALKHAHEILGATLFEVAGTPISVATLAICLLIVVLTFVFSSLAQRGAGRALRSRGVVNVGSIQSTNRLIHYLFLFIGLGIALHTIGVNLNALFAAGALFAVGIGFALQNITQNFVSGLILLIERVIKPGDIIEVDGMVGRVVRMAIRSTVVRTRDGEDVIVPNSSIVQSNVKNYTLDDGVYRIKTVVGVVYSSDMALVRTTLEAVAREVSHTLSPLEPQVLMWEFGSHSVDFEVAIWVNDPWRARPARSELNEKIWWALKGKGIVIAFPQLDVHFDPPVTESVVRLQSSAF